MRQTGQVHSAVRQTGAERDDGLAAGQEVRGVEALGRGIETVNAGDADLIHAGFRQNKVLDLLCNIRHTHDLDTPFDKLLMVSLRPTATFFCVAIRPARPRGAARPGGLPRPFAGRG